MNATIKITSRQGNTLHTRESTVDECPWLGEESHPGGYAYEIETPAGNVTWTATDHGPTITIWGTPNRWFEGTGAEFLATAAQLLAGASAEEVFAAV